MLFVPAILALVSAAAAALPEIEIIGNKFYYSNNGSQFLMKGVAYQADTANTTSNATFNDPLADYSTCSRDIPYLQELLTNVIRVYALNISADHTQCMQALADAGIYLIADLSTPTDSIVRNDPSWDTELFDHYTSVIDAFHNYTNVLGFFAGNEVVNSESYTDAAPYVKAAIRDVKAYMKEKGYRNIPVGYSAADDSDIRVDLASYFACGDADDRADFFGLNMYQWCGDSSFTESGYLTVTQQYANLGIPIFFSEYGCNVVQPRKFTEVSVIYSEEMTSEWSGGIVYMYFEEANNYGLVTIVDDKVSTLTDFNYLKSELAQIDPTFATADSASSSQAVTGCPATGSYWDASTDLPPTPNEGICECMQNALTCVVADSVSSDDYADLFSYVCGSVDCSGVNGNGTMGKYGTFSYCEAKQKLNFVLNRYYLENGENASACDFSGSASTQSATTASSCSAYLSQAGVSGVNAITSTGSGALATGSDSLALETGLTTSSASHKSSSGAAASSSLGVALWVAVGGCLALFAW